MELSQQLIAIVLVLVLLWASLTVAHRRGRLRFHLPLRRGPERSLELVDRLALTPQHGIHCIRARGRVLLLATYPGGIEWLNVNETPESRNPGMAAAASVGFGARRERLKEEQQ